MNKIMLLKILILSTVLSLGACKVSLNNDESSEIVSDTTEVDSNTEVTINADDSLDEPITAQVDDDGGSTVTVIGRAVKVTKTVSSRTDVTLTMTGSNGRVQRVPITFYPPISVSSSLQIAAQSSFTLECEGGRDDETYSAEVVSGAGSFSGLTYTTAATPEMVTVKCVGSNGGESDDYYVAVMGSELKVWFDAMDLLSSVADGGAVATWADKSGGGNDATVASGSPTLTYRGLNGWPVVGFDGTDDQMDILADPLDSTEVWVMFVGAMTDGGGRRVIIGDGSTGNAAWYINFFSGNLNATFLDSASRNAIASQTSPNADIGTAMHAYGLRTTATGADQIQGADIVSDTYSAGYTATNFDLDEALSLGGHAGSWFTNVAMTEVLIGTGQLNDTQLEVIRCYLDRKYSLDELSSSMCPW